MIEAAAPKDEIEGALAVQMACTHHSRRGRSSQVDVAFATERRLQRSDRRRLVCSKAYAVQVKVFDGCVTAGSNLSAVEHVQYP